MKIFYHGEILPWGGVQDWGRIMLLTPIQGAYKSDPNGGIGLLSGDAASDIEDLTEITSSLAAILASALDRETVDTAQGSGKGARDELEMAGKLQSRILPEKPPIIDGWDLATQLLLARETSGEFYDFIPLGNDKWGILIADVTDKGLGAAVFMAICKFIDPHLCSSFSDPTSTCSQLGQ